jgi:aryl-alcohol dehydrogenase-like predicted oxidoreductase
MVDDLVKQGKLRFLGLSQAGGANIRSAQAVRPVCAADRIFSALATAAFRKGIVPLLTADRWRYTKPSFHVSFGLSGSKLTEAFDDLNLCRTASGMGARRITEPSAKLL